VLDIGMGDGAFLASMRKQGWTVTGLDVEPSVVHYARTQLDLPDCQVADVEQDPLPQGAFDAITLWGMLQLSYHPQALLERIRPSLAPEGVLAIGLSNFVSAGATLFGTRWRGLGLPRHLVHHDPASLRSLVERSGYRVLEVSFETPAWIVNGSMDAALPVPGLLGRILRYSVRTALGGVGRSRWGDTLTLVAESADR
jgi:SAM-dependent methyltransferase